MSKTVIFDFDGTIITKDLTRYWVIQQIKSSFFKIALGLIVIPSALLLFLIPRCHHTALQLLFWLASLGLNEQQLQQSFVKISSKVYQQQIAIYWHKQALDVLQWHLSKQHRIIIASSAPLQLLDAFFGEKYPELQLIGSTLTPKLQGFVTDYYCHGQKKSEAIVSAGFQPLWDYAYSDNSDDLELLSQSHFAFCVNPNRSLIKQIKRETPQIRIVFWN